MNIPLRGIQLWGCAVGDVHDRQDRCGIGPKVKIAVTGKNADRGPLRNVSDGLDPARKGDGIDASRLGPRVHQVRVISRPVAKSVHYEWHKS